MLNKAIGHAQTFTKLFALEKFFGRKVRLSWFPQGSAVDCYIEGEVAEKCFGAIFMAPNEKREECEGIPLPRASVGEAIAACTVLKLGCLLIIEWRGSIGVVRITVDKMKDWVLDNEQLYVPIKAFKTYEI